MTRLVVTLCFPSMPNAAAARDELRLAGYEVVICSEYRDAYALTAFAEVFTNTALTGANLAAKIDAFHAKVEELIEPFGGDCDEWGEAGDNHVLFEHCSIRARGEDCCCSRRRGT
jgi:hypothetical protein